MRVLISGGGTGGHVYPALAVAPHLRQAAAADAAAAPAAAPESNLLWIGSTGGMEQALVQREGIPYRGIDTGQLRGIRPLNAAANIGKMVRGVRQTLAILHQFQPDVCLVTGGYVCAPVVVACRLRRIPVLIYLPDMAPGWAIRLLSLLAQRVAVSFPAAAAHFGGEVPTGKAVVTGYPVRSSLVEAARDRAAARHELAHVIDRPPLNGGDRTPMVLVWGGSQGARTINQATWKALADLLPHAHVVHVVGTRDWPLAKEQMQAMRDSGVLTGGSARRYHPVDYLHEAMPLALAAADLTVARAGASILGEFPVAGLPAILAPLPFAGVNQQRNAAQLAQAGAAVVVEDANLEQDLARTVIELLTQQDRLAGMAKAAAALARPDAAQAIAGELAKLAQHRAAR